MEFNKETSSGEIIDFLKQNHHFRYHTLPEGEGLRILKKTNGFGTYLHIMHNGTVLESLKISGGGDHIVVSLHKLKEALESLGFIVEDSESTFKD
jgi:hypothetical protein